LDRKAGGVVDIPLEKDNEQVMMPSLEEEKVAVVIIPQQNEDENFMIPLTNHAISLLEDLEYTIVRVEGREDIHRIRASQVVLLYIGHSMPTHPNLLFPVSGEQLWLAEIIEHIDAERLIMLTNACYGGSWLEFQAENRLIISSVNNSESLIVGSSHPETGITCEVSIVDLLIWSQYASVEQAYVIWEQSMIQFFESAGHSGAYPVIYDGIPGNVRL
jgi:hypothetical protein